MDCIWVNLKNVGPPFSNLRYVNLYVYQNVIYTAGKSFLSCYVAIILQMKDSWSANLTFHLLFCEPCVKLNTQDLATFSRHHLFQDIFKMTGLASRGGVVYISQGGEVRRGPSYPDPV